MHISKGNGYFALLIRCLSDLTMISERHENMKKVDWLIVAKKSLKIPKGQSESYIEEEQTTQWPKEKVQKDKQRSTKHTY
jgi:hypothetical protein